MYGAHAQAVIIYCLTSITLKIQTQAHAMTVSLAAIHGIHRHFRDLHGESASPRPLMMRYAEERYAAYGKRRTCGHQSRLGIGILLPSVGVIVYNSPQHASCKRRDAKSQTRPSGCLQRPMLPPCLAVHHVSTSVSHQCATSNGCFHVLYAIAVRLFYVAKLCLFYMVSPPFYVIGSLFHVAVGHSIGRQLLRIRSVWQCREC